MFSTYKPRIMATSNDFTTCHKSTGRCFKKICLAFSLVHVIKTVTRDLTDVWHIIFSSDATDILLCVGIGIGYKI